MSLVQIERSPGLHRLLYRGGLMSAPPEEGGGRFTRRMGIGLFEIYRVTYEPDWEEAWALTEAMMLEVHALATRNGSRFGVVLVPHGWEIYPAQWQRLLQQVPAMREVRMDVDKPARQLSLLFDSHGIPYVNLGFRERAGSTQPLYIRGDGHWTAAGHRLAAELTAPFVGQLLAASESRAARR